MCVVFSVVQFENHFCLHGRKRHFILSWDSKATHKNEHCLLFGTCCGLGWVNGGGGPEQMGNLSNNLSRWRESVGQPSHHRCPSISPST